MPKLTTHRSFLEYRLGDIAGLVMGRTPPKTGGNYAGSLPWITISDLTSKDVETYTGHVAGDLFKTRLPAGTLIGSFKMSVGRFAFTTEESVTNEAIIALLNVREDVSPAYLYFVLPDLFRNAAVANAQGTPLLNKERISEIRVALPSKDVQDRVASFLDFYERTIQQIEKLISCVTDVHVNLRQSLFGALDQREQKTGTLAELFDVVCGGTPSKVNADYWGGNIPWIALSDMTKQSELEIGEGANFLTEAGAKTLQNRLVPKGSLILTTRATIGKSKVAQRDLYTNQGCHSFIAKGPVSPMFLHHLLETKLDELGALGAGSTFLEVSTSKLRNFVIEYPSLLEQHRIVEILGESSKAISDLLALKKLEIKKFEELRCGLVGGTLRLPD